MGDTIIQLKPDELMACSAALDIVNRLGFELGLAKRGHQHLWKEIATKYDVQNEKVNLNYKTGVMTIVKDPTDG